MTLPAAEVAAAAAADGSSVVELRSRDRNDASVSASAESLADLLAFSERRTFFGFPFRAVARGIAMMKSTFTRD